jgi:hypothetical protein
MAASQAVSATPAAPKASKRLKLDSAGDDRVDGRLAVFLVAGNWTSGRASAWTKQPPMRSADLPPLSTRVAGLVASVEVADYQTVIPRKEYLQIAPDRVPKDCSIA